MKSDERSMSIGKVAGAAAVNVETIRYYERIGILDEPPRRPDSRYRAYPPDTVLKIRFVKRAQELGFSLQEIRELLAFEAASGDDTCADVRAIASRKIADIDMRIRDLTRMSTSLKALVVACQRGRAPGCPIIATLADTERADG